MGEWPGVRGGGKGEGEGLGNSFTEPAIAGSVNPEGEKRGKGGR